MTLPGTSPLIRTGLEELDEQVNFVQNIINRVNYYKVCTVYELQQN